MKSKFLEKVRKTIEKYRLPEPEEGPVIVALSGGPDSVALLDVLVGLGYSVIAAHCNFHLRGDESNRDMAFATDLCRHMGIVCETISFDVESRRKLTGESVEMACRELRYEWFGTLVEKYGASALATGHHRDDNIETLILNLLRSSGLRGASAISPASNRRISPLLECSRSEITEYLSGRGLSFVTDHTNLENDYSRNKVRNVILPAIESQFPDARQRLADSISHLADDMKLLDEAVIMWRRQYIGPDNTIVIDEVKRSGAPESLMFRLLEPYGFNRCQTDGIVNGERSGARYRSDEFEAVVSRGIVRLHQIGYNDCDLTPQIVTELVDVTDFVPLRDPSAATFDSSILDGDPDWEVRAWRQGDRMKPFGMNGRSKKLSDIFNDAKVDDLTKQSRIVVTRNGEIVWVAGLRQSDLYRVDDTTRTIVKMSLDYQR